MVQLSELDKEILCYMATGLTARETGKKVFRGKRTVENRIYRMLIAFQARNITHLVAIAITKGLIKPK